MTKCCRLRNQEITGKGFGNEIRKQIIGDVGLADDTAIMGKEEEVRVAEIVFKQTLEDWEEKMHTGKTERLRLSGTKRRSYDVRIPGEASVVRHTGGWVSEDCGHTEDTKHRVGQGFGVIRKIAKAWSTGTHKGRGAGSGVRITTRLDLLKQTLIPTITTFARSRAWNKTQLRQVERVARYAVRRAFGMDRLNMQEYHVSDEMLYQASGWNTVTDTIRRLTLQWVGHIARMPLTRRPKQMLFGWWAGRKSKFRFGVILQPIWLRRVIKDAGVPKIDWFRLAQDRKGWRKLVDKAYPKSSLTKDQRTAINEWHPGKPLPGVNEEAEEIVTGWEEESEESSEEEREDTEGTRREYKCPVCGESHGKGNQLQYHYDEDHSVRDPDIVTVTSHQCEMCNMNFARKYQLYKHKGWTLKWSKEPKAEPCKAKAAALETRDRVEARGWTPVYHGPELPPPEGWWIATDGSGTGMGGWGVAIFRTPIQGDEPHKLLYGPVMTDSWDHRWLGAREATNNTAELTAIGEAMLWLKQEAGDDGTLPVMLRFDSKYAVDSSRGRTDPQSNKELVEELKKLVEEVQEDRVITWEWVKGHTGQHDNELADQAADLGAKGHISMQSLRWNAPHGVFPARRNVPEVKLKRIMPNRSAYWAAKRAGQEYIGTRSAAAKAAAAKAKAKAKAKPTAKASGKAKAKARPVAKASVKAKAKAKAKPKGKAKAKLTARARS